MLTLAALIPWAAVTFEQWQRSSQIKTALAEASDGERHEAWRAGIANSLRGMVVEVLCPVFLVLVYWRNAERPFAWLCLLLLGIFLVSLTVRLWRLARQSELGPEAALATRFGQKLARIGMARRPLLGPDTFGPNGAVRTK
jgi:hypothetical protein